MVSVSTLHGNFNPRPRGEGDITGVREYYKAFISIHALAGRATCNGPRCWTAWPKFQSTPSRGGRQQANERLNRPGQFQSTPSRGGRRPRGYQFLRLQQISIHALAGRATPDLIWLCECGNISIHALAGRATKASANKQCIIIFQSTPSRGGRLRNRQRLPTRVLLILWKYNNRYPH